MTIDIEPLRKALGRKIEDEDVVTAAPIKAMICTFDRDEKVPAPGEPIAPGWHLCFLHSYARRASLGTDGAAAEGGVLPRIPMPRRMYAGSTFTFDGDIRVGDKVSREIEFSDIQLRQGTTGNLIVTAVPRPFSLSTEISPPLNSMFLSAIGSPRPVPDVLVEK